MQKAVDVVEVVLSKAKVGKTFKGDAKKIMEYFNNLDDGTAEKYDEMLKDAR